jgi:membrane associated rhomboid family serine protease
LGGAVAGVLAAWLLHRRASRQAVPAAPIRRY